MCKYCKNENGQNDYLETGNFIMVDIYKSNQPNFTIDIEALDISAEIQIEYCPMCGRKLNDER